jgi:2-C-methyl-D-erythritol 4-phosphate cytidylyltransferase
MERARVWTVVVAGGRGTRFGRPKQLVDLDGRSVLEHSVAAAARASAGVVVVLPEDLLQDVPGAATVVAGGSTRSESVRAGLAAVPETCEVVLVHDAARPLASDAVFQRVIEAVQAGADAAVPAVPVTDTIRKISGGVVDRSQLVAVQTPQGFRASALRAAHSGAPDATDDASLVEAAGGRVVIVDGEVHNLKITQPEDLLVARALLQHP